MRKFFSLAIDEELLKQVYSVVAYQNHQFYVFFPIGETTSAEQYTAMKHKVAQIFPYFDKNALDAGRFFFGTQYSKVEIFAGNSNLTAFLAEYDASHSQAVSQATIPASSEPVATDNIKVPNEHNDIIPQGRRNSTLLRYAEEELSDIWRNAVRYYQTDIATNSGYIQPEDFNAPFLALKILPTSDRQKFWQENTQTASDIQMVQGSSVSTGLTGKKVIHMRTE